MGYAAPAMTYEAPMSGQPVYTISPERFQRIMAGEPLTNEEIAAMTGAPQPVSMEMPTTGSMTYAAPAAVETVAAVADTTPAPAPTSAKKSSKKNSKKKLSSKKKAKGCC